MISLSANSRRNSRLNIGADTPADPGLALLLTMEGWWDAASYSGSGNLLNRGTGGSSHDMVLGAATAAPTFSTDNFVFDGSNDYMSADSSNFDIGAAQSASYGVIVKHTLTPPTTLGGTYISKMHALPGWQLMSNFYSGTDIQPVNWFAETGGAQNNPHTAPPTALATNTKLLITGIRNVGADTIEVWNKATQVGTTTDTTTTSTGSGQPLRIGGGPGTGDQRYQRMTLYGAFFYRGVLTAQNLTDIATHYGV